jgi:enoyl-CoA hydratase
VGYDLLELNTVGEVLVVAMNRPPANAMSLDLLAEGARLVGDLEGDLPGAVVITGGGRFFSGGVDLKLAPTLSAEEQVGMVDGINELFLAWYGFARPVVAAVNGHAVAGGLILALCADHRIAVPGAKLGLTEARVGVPYPVAAMGVVRAELAPPVARRLVLEAELIDAARALEWDVVDEIREPAELMERALQKAGDLAALPSRAYEAVKGQLRGGALEAMRTAVAEDPMGGEWLSDETADAARSVLEGPQLDA